MGARLKKCCEIVGISIRTYERWNKSGTKDKRKTIKKEPKNKLTKQEEKKILETVNQKEYANLTPRQIVPLLLEKGIYLCSESTMYRVLKKYNQITRRRKTRPPKKRKRPDTHIATKPNQIWTWDITYLKKETKGKYLKLYMILDIYSRYIVGWEIHEEENGELASILLEKTAIREKITLKQRKIILHSDNGSPMKSYMMKEKMEELGVTSSFSRPRVSNDNPYSESIFKTMKYTPIYPRKFKTKEQAREWVYNFVSWYNNEHLHSGINYYTPSTIHNQRHESIVNKRETTYKKARILNPIRFSDKTRDFDPPIISALNPTQEERLLIENGEVFVK